MPATKATPSSPPSDSVLPHPPRERPLHRRPSILHRSSLLRSRPPTSHPEKHAALPSDTSAYKSRASRRSRHRSRTDAQSTSYCRPPHAPQFPPSPSSPASSRIHRHKRRPVRPASASSSPNRTPRSAARRFFPPPRPPAVSSAVKAQPRAACLLYIRPRSFSHPANIEATPHILSNPQASPDRRRPPPPATTAKPARLPANLPATRSPGCPPTRSHRASPTSARFAAPLLP